jgi:hypothetical protein
MTDQSLTISDFCEAEKLSRSMLYKMWTLGKGPRFFLIGNSKRISQESRETWRRQLEAEVEVG